MIQLYWRCESGKRFMDFKKFEEMLKTYDFAP